MLKKLVYGVAVASLVLAAQAASADDAQFWTGETYQGISAIPFDAFAKKDGFEAAAPEAAPQVERLMPREGTMQLVIVPTPYDTDAGYFN